MTSPGCVNFMHFPKKKADPFFVLQKTPAGKQEQVIYLQVNGNSDLVCTLTLYQHSTNPHKPKSASFRYVCAISFHVVTTQREGPTCMSSTHTHTHNWYKTCCNHSPSYERLSLQISTEWGGSYT